MTEYKTIKRKARAGERILIKNAWASGGFYGNGFILYVATTSRNTVDVVGGFSIDHDEYEVIIEDEAAEKTCPRSYIEGFEVGRAYERGELSVNEDE